jgi:cytochrome P450
VRAIPSIDLVTDIGCVLFGFVFVLRLGKDLGQLDRIHLPPIRSSSPSPNAKFAEDFDYAQNQMDFRFAFVTFWKVIEKVHFRLGRKIKSACDTLNQYATSLINERMAKFDLDAQKDEESPTDLLGFFLKMRKEMGDDLGEEEIRDALVNLIIAGR